MNRNLALALAAAAIVMPALAHASTVLKDVNATAAAKKSAQLSIDAYKLDPTNSSKACKAGIDPFGLLEFQFTVQYDSELLQVSPFGSDGSPVIAINGYQLARIESTTGNEGFIDDGRGSIIVHGIWTGTTPPPQIDQNVFTVGFRYRNTDRPSNIPITLSVGPTGNGDGLADFVVEDNGDGTSDRLDYRDIKPAFITFNLNASASVGLVPHVPPPTGAPEGDGRADLVVHGGPGGYDVAIDDYIYKGRGTEVIEFDPPKPENVLIALDLTDDNGGEDIKRIIEECGLVPAVLPIFGHDYEAMFFARDVDGGLFDFNFDFSGSSVRLTGIAVVPEPTTATLLLPAAALLAKRRRRA